MHLDLSCVLLTWNSGKWLSKCLNSLRNDLQTSQLNFEIIVIDNGSMDNSLEILQTQYEQDFHLLVIPLGRNMGTTFSRNIGLKMAKGKYICILDSDVEICEAQTIARLIASVERFPNVGIMAPALQYPSGNYQKSVDEFPTLFTKVKRFFFLKHVEYRTSSKTLANIEIKEVDYAISAFWLLKREVIKTVGMLDENIYYAPEDVDYCVRCWQKGFSVLFDNSVTAIHHAQEIGRKNLFSRAFYSHIKGLWYYFCKHKCLFSSSAIRKKILS